MARVKPRELTQFAKKEIDVMFKKARRVVNQSGFSVLCAPAQKEFGRLLIIAPKAVGSAPVRNKLRRRLKSIFYEERLFERGFDCIVLAKKEAASLSFDELKMLMLKACNTKQS